ncbi:MAG: zinc-binding dehydrogenase [Bacteroidota bacterium]
MKAYLLNKTGDSKVLQIHDIPEPELNGVNQVLVKVVAIGLNYAEVLSRKGQYSWAPPRPYVPGMECFGEVLAVSEDVTHVQPGEKVIVGGQYGSYAEVIRASGHLVFPAFESFTDSQNAAYVVNFMTAWIALARQARIRSGEKVLIHAAAGGVGTAAVQIAKAVGAVVIGTVGSDEKAQVVSDLGADVVINYRKDDFYQLISERYSTIDAVLEVVGGDVFRQSVKLLSPFGRVCVAGYASIPLNKWNPLTYWKTWKDAPKLDVMQMARESIGLFATHIGYLTQNELLTRELFGELKEFTEKHQLKPVVGRVYNFDQIPEAHAFMQSRQSVGKIVIKVD